MNISNQVNSLIEIIFSLDKVHLTGYVLQPEPQESTRLLSIKDISSIPFSVHEEGHLPIGKGKGIFQAAGESSSDDDDDDDDDDESDDDDEQDFHLAHRHRLRDDEVNKKEQKTITFNLIFFQDQDLEGDYEDGYLEGEDQLSSDTSSSSDSDNDERPKTVSSKSK